MSIVSGTSDGVLIVGGLLGIPITAGYFTYLVRQVRSKYSAKSRVENLHTQGGSAKC